MGRISGKSGAVYVGQQIIDACDVVWSEQVDADVTASLDTGDYKVGGGSCKFVCAAGLGAGDIIASQAIGALDLTGYDTLMAWLKSSVLTAAADIQLQMDDNAMLASPTTTTDIPILAAGEWRLCVMPQDLSGAGAIISIGLLYTVDIGAADIWIDHIMAAKAVAGIRSWTLDYVMNTQETTGFDSSGHKTFVPTIDEWAGSFEGFKDGAPLAIGSVVHLQLRESAVATQAWIGSAIITAIHPNVAVDGVAMYSYDFQGTKELAVPTA